MDYIALYKYNYRYYPSNPALEPGEELSFNYYDVGFAVTNGRELKCVDSIKIVDVLPDALTGIDWGTRKQDDIKLLDMGRFSLGFDLENGNKSELGKTIDEFLATAELSYRQIFVVAQYGNIAYEGWLDKQSITRDKTHTEQKWDLNFEVDGPSGHFFDSMKSQNVQKVPATGTVGMMDYFRLYHFIYWFNNGSVTTYVDGTNLQEKLNWTDQGPIISNPLQRSILFSDMSVKDATKSFALGLGFMFELESIRPFGYEPFHKIPFKMNIKIEGDTENTVEVGNLLAHKQGYTYNALQHFILPYWKLSGTPAQTEAYYWGLFMSANAQRIENNDFFEGADPIILYNAGARKDLYEIVGGGYYARKEDTYLLDVEYREQGLFQTTVAGEQYNVALAYFRILIKEHWMENFHYRDRGFEGIAGVTAQRVYQYMCGQFKEKHFITISYEPDTTIKPGTVIDCPDIGKLARADRLKKIDIKKQEAEWEVVET
ncbi:MAG TPA: hypothetical protein PKD94_04605 [Ignavibacteria bacterium]|nr:hypothetical protein [Ignavibacteria bacterium]